MMRIDMENYERFTENLRKLVTMIRMMSGACVGDEGLAMEPEDIVWGMVFIERDMDALQELWESMTDSKIPPKQKIISCQHERSIASRRL